MAKENFVLIDYDSLGGKTVEQAIRKGASVRLWVSREHDSWIDVRPNSDGTGVRISSSISLTIRPESYRSVDVDVRR